MTTTSTSDDYLSAAALLAKRAHLGLREVRVIETPTKLILVGVVESYYLKQMAQQIVLEALVGRELVNDIQVEGTNRTLNWEATVTASPSLDRVEVIQSQDRVILQGAVESDADKQLAEEFVSSAFPRKRLESHIAVVSATSTGVGSSPMRVPDSCAEMNALIVPYYMRDLPEVVREVMRSHFESCLRCRTILEAVDDAMLTTFPQQQDRK